MTSGRLTVLLDEGTPILVADPFKRNGHRVIFFDDVLEPGSKDDQVV